MLPSPIFFLSLFIRHTPKEVYSHFLIKTHSCRHWANVTLSSHSLAGTHPAMCWLFYQREKTVPLWETSLGSQDLELLFFSRAIFYYTDANKCVKWSCTLCLGCRGLRTSPASIPQYLLCSRQAEDVLSPSSTLSHCFLFFNPSLFIYVFLCL